MTVAIPRYQRADGASDSGDDGAAPDEMGDAGTQRHFKHVGEPRLSAIALNGARVWVGSETAPPNHAGSLSA